MPDFDCDLFIIGGGSAGVRAARMAAQRGARVALAEAAALGGTCVNVGCIPKKLYAYAAGYGHAFDEARGYGWTGERPRLDWQALKANRAREIERLNGVYASLLRDAGVQVHSGWARLVDGHTVAVRTPDGERSWRARHIALATGGTPTVPPLPGRELTLTSDDMFDLEPFPRRLLVVGAGYIACEFASIFQGLGAQVTQLVRGGQVLRGFDDEVRGFVGAQLRASGIDLRTGCELQAIARNGEALSATLADGGTLSVDAVLHATGRTPNVAGLGLEAAGVAQAPGGAVLVDANYRTSVPSVHALGDVTARVQLTPVALAEAMALVDHLFGDSARQVDYELIPTAVFTHPNIATVGLTEEQAAARFDDVLVYRSDFKPLRHTLSGSTERALIKLLVDGASDRVVGLHMVGAEAGEVVQGFAVAMRAGATKAVFDSTVGIHPTVAEEFVTLREPARRVRRT